MRIGLRVLATSLAILCTVPSVLAVPSGPFQLFVDPTLSSPSAPFFTTIGSAMSHVAADTDGATSYHILVYPGVYTEHVTLDQPHVTLEGVSRDRVKLVSIGEINHQIQLAADSLTVRNLTLVRDAGDTDLVYNMQVLLDDDRDNVLVENCRFMDAQIGVLFLTTNSSAEFNDNIQFRNNLVESTILGIHLDAAFMGDNKGYVDFLAQDNRIVIRNTGGGSVGYMIRRLAETSRFRALSDSLDILSEDGSGTGDVNGYVFEDWMPEVSQVIGAEIRLTYIDRTDTLQSFAGIKIHGQAGSRMPASGERAVVVSAGNAIHIVDRTTGVGGGGHGYQNAGARVDVFVSGGTVTWELDDPSNFDKGTFSLVGGARDSAFDDGSPNGIFYAGVPVDEIIVGSGSGVDGVVAPYDQGAIKATQGLVGSSETIQIDDLADAAYVDQAETISGAWTHTGALNMGNGSGTTPSLTFQGGGPDWWMEVLSGGALQLRTNVSSTTELKFVNEGSGNINYRFDNGFLLPDADGNTSLGVDGLEFGSAFAHQGFFDTRLEIPRTTSSGTRDALMKHHLLIDQTTSTPRLCVGIDNGSTILTHCVNLTCIETGCP